MLGHNYISINGTPIPNPEQFKTSYANIENVKQNELGEDVGNPQRLLKRTFSFSFNSTSRGRAKIMTFCALSMVTININGTQYQGRLRLTGDSLVKNSEMTAGTDGLYTLTVSFMER